MKFRMIWLGSDDESNRRPSVAPRTPSSPRSLSRTVEYEQRGTEMVRREQFEDGRVRFIPLANFIARIVRDVVWDDGTDRRRDFALEAELVGRKMHVVVPAAEFGRMGWVLRQLGPHAIIYPGQQQHARAAIQWLSGAVPTKQIFTHLGWRKLDQNWVYLQAGNAISARGTLANCQVRLPAPLQYYQMSPPSDRDQLTEAIRSSLRFLSVAPDRVSLPLLAAVYRVPLGGVDFSLFLTGRSGTFKTALATLCQQHFGEAMDARCLPANFASTANALEELSFSAKDALLVVDDFVPTGRVGDSALHSVAERLFRSVGNHQGRIRMSGQKTLVFRPPRGLLLATGEEVPQGQSLRARLLIVELRAGEVDKAVLTRCQAAGQNGRFSCATAAYLSWIAGRYEELQKRFRDRVRQLRNLAPEGSLAVHARLPTTLADLQSGWEIWLSFACDVGAISSAERVELEARCRRALDELVATQVYYQQASDPALHFLNLLRAALAGARAHVANRRGTVPDSPERWGWRRHAGRAWVAQGKRIGWVAAGDLFLEPSASHEMAQQMAGAERLIISAQTLRHHLKEHGLLVSVDTGRQMLLVRRILEGCSRQVLHLKANTL